MFSTLDAAVFEELSFFLKGFYLLIPNHVAEDAIQPSQY